MNYVHTPIHGFHYIHPFHSLKAYSVLMNLESQPSLVADLILAGGEVIPRPVTAALKELATAVRIDDGDRPYGAVISSGEHLGPAEVWRLLLVAKDRLNVAVAGVSGAGTDFLQALRAYAPADDIQLISTSREADPTRFLIDFAKDRYRSTAYVDDVFLLLSGSDLVQMTRKAAITAYPEMRLLVLVSGESRPIRALLPSLVSQPQELSDDHIDDDRPPDSPTRDWREHFVKSVPCFTAEQIAHEVGHEARNKSATASRWTSDGKIFAVRYGGKLRYPVFQFKNGVPRPIIARVLRALGEDPTGWDYAFFFTTPNGYIDNDTPMDRINDKEMEDTLVRLAERHAHPAEVF